MPLGASAARKEINVLMESVPDTDFVLECLPEFEKATGIKVNIESVTYAAMHEKLIPQLTARRGSYDVIVVDKQWVGEFVGAGWLEPLDRYIANTKGFDTSVYVPALFNQIGQVHGSTYMLPFYNYSMGLVYRTDLFEDAQLKAEYKKRFGKDLAVPTTVEDYIQTAKFMTRNYKGEQIYGVIPQLARGVGIHAEWACLMFALGGDYYDSRWKPTVNKGGALRAAEVLLELYKTSAPAGATAYNFDEVFSAMSQGKGTMMATYGWMLAKLNDPEQSKVAGKVAMTVMPGGHAVGGGWGWAIPKSAPDADAAWQFLSWVESFEVAKKRALLGGAPTRFDVFRDKEVLAKYPTMSEMEKIVATGKPMPIMLRANQVVDVLARELSEAMTSRKTVQKAMDDAARELDRLADNDPLVRRD